MAPETLQGTTDDHAPDRIGGSSHDAADTEDDQTKDDQWFTANAVRHQPKRDLEYGLCQTINTDCDADQRFAGTG